VFKVADRYGVSTLRTVAVTKFNAEFKNLLGDPPGNRSPLVFLRAIKHAYTVPFDASYELRENIVKMASPYAKWLFANRWDFKDFEKQCPKFVFDMVQKM
jgi:hypothetical protein